MYFPKSLSAIFIGSTAVLYTLDKYMLRQFFPKGTDFNEFSEEEIDKSEEEIDKAAALINNRPRKCLNYRTPHEVLWSG